MPLDKIYLESPTVQRLIARKVDESVALALEKAVEQALPKAVEKAVEEISHMAKRKYARERILFIVGKRFGSVPTDLANHISAIENQETLDHLLEICATSSDLASFRNELGKR